MTEQTKALLQSRGFVPRDAYGLGLSFSEAYAFTLPGLTVEGEHATDYLEILYTESREVDAVPSFSGLLYGGCVMFEAGTREVMEKRFRSIEKKLNAYLQIKVRFRDVEHGRFLTVAITPDSSQFEDYVAEMLKAAVLMDYFYVQEKRKVERRWARESSRSE